MKNTEILGGIAAALLLVGCSHSGDEGKVAVSPPSGSDTAMPPDRRSTHIVCYSGSQVVYVGDSTPEMPPSFSDGGVSFRDAKTGHAMHIIGTCLVTYQD